MNNFTTLRQIQAKSLCLSKPQTGFAVYLSAFFTNSNKHELVKNFSRKSDLLKFVKNLSGCFILDHNGNKYAVVDGKLSKI